jgi:hypothetical protein
MKLWTEIVIQVGVDRDRLAEFPELIDAALGAWADRGVTGRAAVWAIYEQTRPIQVDAL